MTSQTSAPELTAGVNRAPPVSLVPHSFGEAASPTLTPMKPDRPMCTVVEALPALISSAMEMAWLIGIAKPWVAVVPSPPAAGAGAGGGVHADHLAAAVDERAAGVALLDRRIGLEHAVQALGRVGALIAGLDRLVERLDGALRGRRQAAPAAGVAEREHRLADLGLAWSWRG